jgi:isopenicillin-N N-acyltransferase like protein
MMILEFTGDARERGRPPGRRLRTQIHARIRRSVPSGSGPAQPWLDRIDALAGPLGAELRGIAEGSGARLEDVVLLNAFEAIELARQVELGGCTAVVGRGPTGTVLAQNWDANPALAASLAVHLHRGPDIATTVLLASPGGLGWTGMNDRGVALVNNDLLTRATRPGVPSQAARRHALAATTAAGAVGVLTNCPPAGGRSYLVADADEAYTVELAAETAPSVTRQPGDAAHTNHAHAPAIAAFEDAELLAATYPSSTSRLDRAVHLLRTRSADADIAGILADHSGYPLSICRHPSPGEPTVTAASVVFDCAQRRATIALGNPCRAESVEITLTG